MIKQKVQGVCQIFILIFNHFSDIALASTKLRCQYAEEVISTLANQSLVGNHDATPCHSNNDLYTELAVLKANEIDQDLNNNSDRDALLEQRHLKKDSIELDKLFQQDDDVVFVRGVGATSAFRRRQPFN